MRVAVVGSRTFDDFELLEKTLIENFGTDGSNYTLVSGGAKGADKLSETFSKKYNIDIQIFKPDWEKYGKAAGMIRNTSIVNNSDVIVAFWDGISKGTKNTITKAEKKNIKVILIKYIKC